MQMIGRPKVFLDEINRGCLKSSFLMNDLKSCGIYVIEEPRWVPRNAAFKFYTDFKSETNSNKTIRTKPLNTIHWKHKTRKGYATAQSVDWTANYDGLASTEPQTGVSVHFRRQQAFNAM